MSNDENKFQPIFQILHIKSAWFLLELAMALVTTIGMRFLQVCSISSKKQTHEFYFTTVIKFIYPEKARKILRNLHLNFDWHCIGQKYGGDFAKVFGLLRIYELYWVIQYLRAQDGFCLRSG